MTQTELYERLRNDHTQLNLRQRSFEKCKPWYVRICIDRNTCCCRCHVEYGYFYDMYKHVFCDLHINLEQGCNESVIPPNALRDFIANIMCPRHEGQKYYGKSCLYGNCSRCSGFSLLNHFIHGSDGHQIGNMSVEMHSFKYVTYQSDSAKESKNIALVKSQVQMIIDLKFLTR